jgi:hypothetical protein
MNQYRARRLFPPAALAISLLAAGAAIGMISQAIAADESDSAPTAPRADRPTLDEARSRAALLHDALHATLTTVHHEYYREDEGLTIPAATLKNVFAELESRHGAKLRWLAVNAQAMNTDHQAKDEFERQAVKSLTAGKPFHEAVADGQYRRAAPIILTNDCLKCHLPNRTSTAARKAALVITQELTDKHGK